MFTSSLSELEEDVKRSFVKVGDSIEIFPIYSKKRTILLNRKRITIKCYKGFHLEVKLGEIHLPYTKESKDQFSLEAIHFEKKDIYLIRGINNSLFEFNGNLCNCAFLQKGDSINLKGNRLNFIKKYESDDLIINPKIVESRLNILIQGPTGVGKSYLAKKIHQNSNRQGIFLHINLSSFSENLIESELFGHKKGSFTGAVSDKDGAFKLANKGTLFLDEIDSLSEKLQIKLLLYLDNQCFYPVGSNVKIKTDVRLIFAAGKDTKLILNQNKFRPDFYFRISSGEIYNIKSLNDDPGRTLKLISEYEYRYNVIVDQRLKKFIINQEWPGNIRQLYGYLDKKRILSQTRKLILDDSDYLISDLGIKIEQEIIAFSEVKRSYFKRAFFICNEDFLLTAKRLSVSINTVKNVLSLSIKN